jgi:arsenate reductase
VNIQIFGKNKCFDTKKALRYFKERRIRLQFIDLSEKSVSRGELQSIKAAVGLNNLFDTKCGEYKRLNLDRIVTAGLREEILLNNPSLYRTPIVRNGRQATVGYEPGIWQDWEQRQE